MPSAFHLVPGAQPPIPLVGRDAELTLLHESLDRSVEGNGHLVLISGEAGIGKTSLVQAFSSYATERGTLILRGYCYDLSATPPYGPWLELTDRYRAEGGSPELPEVLKRGTGVGDLSSLMALFEVVREFLVSLAKVRPVTLILEDIHWADQTSLDLLRFLARQLDQQRVLMIATYRDDEVTRQHPLFSRIPLLVRESQAVRIELGALSRENVRTLVTRRWSLSGSDEARLFDHLLTVAEGHPLFTVEVLRTLEQSDFVRQGEQGWDLADLSRVPVPTLVRQVIEGRLYKIDERTRQSLEVAAIIGHQVSLDLLQSVTKLPDEELAAVLDQALALHLLDTSIEDDTVSFVHALTRETLYRGIVPPTRRTWHRMIAEALVDAPVTVPDTVAYHFQQAADPRTADWLIRAGEHAQNTYAWRTAAERFDKAASLLENLPERQNQRGWLLYRAAGSRLRSNPSEGIHLYDTALEIARHTGDARLRALTLSSRGLFKCFTGDVEQGLGEIQRGVSEWESLSQDEPTSLPAPPATAVHPGINLADRGTLIMWLGVAGRYRESLEMGEPYLAQQQQAGAAVQTHPSPEWIDAYDGVATSLAALGHPKRSMEMFEGARAGYRFAGDYIMESNTLNAMLECIVVPYETERVTFRRQLAAEAEEILNRAIGALPPGTDSRIQAVPILRVEGAWDELRDLAARGREWHSNVGRHLELMAHTAFVARHQGEVDLAWSQVREGFPDGPRSNPGNTFFHFAIEFPRIAAELSLDAGDLPGARPWIETYERWIKWNDSTYGRADGILLWARYHYANGDLESAHQYAVESLDAASDPRQPLPLIAAARFLGEVATKQRQFDSANKHIRDSLSLAESCEAPFEVALSNLALAELCVVIGEIHEALRLLGHARALFTDLRARPALEQVEKLAKTLKPRSPEARFGLTARELDVLRLLVQGKSDKQIAEELFISHHTVMRHVSHILTKLDVDSRTAAAAHAVRHGLV